jgi:vanillate O-demethylase ferredoxin subunit
VRNRAFEIYLAWSGTRLHVEPGTSVLAVLLAAGIPVETGCQTGGCGSCVLAYVEGDVIHKDSCLSEADRAHYFCPCVSRAETRIVLAL